MVDVVVTASYAVVGRWREEYDALDLARAQGLLGSMGVGHLANRTFGTLSEGERKRVQIARALMTDPELMLLDEPAAGLDLGGREDLVARLSALAEDVDAPVLVLVTHHVEEIPPGFTDVLLLREGRVVAAGPLELTLTAANLSATFGLPLALDRHGARWSARAADPGRHTDADPGRGPGAARTLDVTADRNLGLGALAADLAASYAGTEAHR